MLSKMVRKSLLRHVRVTVWTLATLTTCGALVAMFTTISMDVEGKMSRSLRRLGANAVVHQEGEQGGRGAGEGRALTSDSGPWALDVPYSPVWQAVDALAKAAGADVLVLRARIGTTGGKPLVVVSADPVTLARMTPYWVVSGERATAPGEGLVGKRIANALGIEVGREVTVQWTASQQASPLRVVGVFESGDEDEDRIFTNVFSFASGADLESVVAEVPPGHPEVPGLSINTQVNCRSCHTSGVPSMQPRLPRDLKPQPIERTAPAMTQAIVTYALLSVSGGEQGIHQLAEQLHAVGAGVSVKPLRQILHGERTVLQKITLLSGLALVAVLVLSSLGVSAAMLARIVERRRELALLQALGAVRRSVVVFLLCESAAVGTVAAAAGFVFGTILAQVVVQRVFHVSITPHFAAFLAAFAATVGVVLLAGVLAARRALHVEPAIALRGE